MILVRFFSKIGIARLLTFALLFVLLFIRVLDPVFVQNIRNQSFDLYQRLKPREFAQQPVIIVDIDEESLQSQGQWPWPRTRLAEMVTNITRQGGIVIGFDIVFSELDRLSPALIAADNTNLPEDVREALMQMPDNEQTFAQAMKASRVVVGETGTGFSASNDQKQEIPEVPYAFRGPDPTRFIAKFPGLVQNTEEISKAAAGRGVFTVDPDPDGIIRKVPLVLIADDKVRLALSTEVLRIATGGQAFLVRSDDAGISAVVVGGVSVPTDTNGRIWPWFTHSDPRRFISAGQVMDGTVPQGALAGKMVLVGTSAEGLKDIRPTPVDAAVPGVEIHAQILENILTSQFLKRPNYALGMELAITALTGILIISIVPWIGALWAAAAAMLVIGVFAAGSWFAFAQERLLIDPTFPIAASLVTFIAITTGNYIREEAQKRQIRSAFGQYLSPALVDQLSDEPDMLVLGGETRELSILFTDVRGFTTISESFKDNPQGLTKLMNHFLTEMSNAILVEEGTIDKYMGDAIMAFWNAPVEAPDHAMKACRAAISMLEAVANLNETYKAEAEEKSKDGAAVEPHKINIGIGINTGDCVVGNMGSEMRFDYTALGDAVNLASRLEGQSKPFGISVVLGDTTAEIVRDELAVIEIDLIRVKGKMEPERIHALLGGPEMKESDEFVALKALNATMISAYRRQDWDSAYHALEELAILADKMGLEFSEYLFVYETRITEYRVNPPGKNWDAVFTATDK
ncbi:MAG: adenylate/guanylate cyclase domain-containing protein [Pseudomonadota bacterium]